MPKRRAVDPGVVPIATQESAGPREADRNQQAHTLTIVREETARPRLITESTILFEIQCVTGDETGVRVASLKSRAQAQRVRTWLQAGMSLCSACRKPYRDHLAKE